MNQDYYVAQVKNIKPDQNGKKYLEFADRSADDSFVVYDESNQVENSKTKEDGLFWGHWGPRNDAADGRCIIDIIKLKEHFYFIEINRDQC